MKNVFLCRDLIKYKPFYSGTVTFGYCSEIF
jgi:hypothetical protein